MPDDPFASSTDTIKDPFASIPGFYDKIYTDDSPKPEPEIIEQPEAPFEEKFEPEPEETAAHEIEFLKLDELFTDIDRELVAPKKIAPQ